MPDDGYQAAVLQHFEGLIDNLKQLWAKTALDSMGGRYHRYESEVLLLACCYLDALAGEFLDGKCSEERFRELLWDYTDRQKCDVRKVSLDALRFKLTEYSVRGTARGDRNFWDSQRVIDYLREEVEKRDYNVGDPTAHDPLVEDVVVRVKGMLSDRETCRHWEAAAERIYEASYAGVLYEKYRSSLVHEAHVVGHWTSQGGDSPFYLAVEGGSIELVFPSYFLIKTLEGIIANIFSNYWTPVY